MKYYVTADVHGYYTELMTALTESGYFEDEEPHKLIICGDLFDRGSGAKKLQDFMLDLLAENEVILIRGNHEDLAMELMNGWSRESYRMSYHRSNRTIDTVCQLTDTFETDIYDDPKAVGDKFSASPYIQSIIPAMRDYFETEHYIFVHGWIPNRCIDLGQGNKLYEFPENWREASDKDWADARWTNGMEAAHYGVIEKGKTIVCGHWHCSFGHCYYEGDGGEFNSTANFSPYYTEGIIALDACTPVSRKVNCIVIED